MLTSHAREAAHHRFSQLAAKNFALALILTLTACASTQQIVHAALRANYVDPDTFLLARVLAPPPADTSTQTRAELDTMLQIQAQRSASSTARAAADAEVSVFRFADAVGSERFTKAALPKTAALFARITEDEYVVIRSVKDAFARPRPFLLEPRLQPAIDKPSSGSYPSGHSTWAYAVGIVLADMLPEKRAAIMERAREYAYHRVVVGVHYPSDVEAGAHCGTALAAMLFASPRFRAEEAAAAAELRAALSLAPRRAE